MFLTIHICTINLLLLFDNTTGMTQLKIKKKVKKFIYGLCNVQSLSNTSRVMKPINVRRAKYLSRRTDEYYLLALIRTEEMNILVNQVFADR